MSESMVGAKSKNRRMLVRGVLLVAYTVLMAIAFVLGKGHTLLIDNKDSEDGSVKAIESLTLSVNGGEPIEFVNGDRDMVKVRSQWHRVVIMVNGQRVEKKITLPVGPDMVLLSIPKLMAGLEPAVIPFVPKEEPLPVSEPAGNENSTASPEGTAAPPAAP